MNADIDTLIREHMWLARVEAADMALRVPAHIEYEDLFSAALTALFQAARRYDPTFGVPFAGFAKRRVRGALQDELRTGDWLSRGDRRHLTKGTPLPTGAPSRSLEPPVSLDHLVVDDDEPFGLSLPDARPGPEEVFLDRELVEYLADAVAELPQRLREAVLNYLAEEPLEALARQLGTSPSRASQLRYEGFALIRNAMFAAYEPGSLPENRNPGGCVTRRRDAYYRAVQRRNQTRRASGEAVAA